MSNTVKDKQIVTFQDECKQFWEVVTHISAHGCDDDDRDIYLDPGVIELPEQENKWLK